MDNERVLFTWGDRSPVNLKEVRSIECGSIGAMPGSARYLIYRITFDLKDGGTVVWKFDGARERNLALAAISKRFQKVRVVDLSKPTPPPPNPPEEPKVRILNEDFSPPRSILGWFRALRSNKL